MIKITKKKKISVRKIAELANVSVATVSRAINNDKKVAISTKKKIFDIMEEYDYKPTESIPIPSQRKCIGLVLASSNSDYYITLQRHINNYCLDKNIDIIHYVLEDRYKNEINALNTMYRLKVDGLILLSCHSKEINDMINPSIPTVWIDSNDNYLQKSKSLWVTSDHYVAGQLAANELIRKGCKKTLILSSQVESNRGALRLEGFKDSFNKAKIPFDESLIIKMPSINNPFIEAKDIVKYHYTKGTPFDSVFAISDWRALGAVIGVQELGLKIPEDIKVIGYDGVSMSSNSILNITSIQQNTELIARNACEMLFKKINKEDILINHIIIPVNLVEGQTT